MNEQQIAERLAERAVCEATHADLRVPHNGFGWTGTRCPKCGFMFFGEWSRDTTTMKAYGNISAIRER